VLNACLHLGAAIMVFICKCIDTEINEHLTVVHSILLDKFGCLQIPMALIIHANTTTSATIIE